MIEWLQEFDTWLFLLINPGLHNIVLDVLMPIFRDKLTWVPFYIVFAGFIIWRFKLNGLIAILFILLVVGLSDYISSSIVKPMFDRVRPCRHPELEGIMNLLVNCGPGNSFTSSHASNHFSIAAIISLIFGRHYRWVMPVTFIWAASISFAQVYVGVHYPLDVTAGAVLGMSIAYGVWMGYKKIPESNQTSP